MSLEADQGLKQRQRLGLGARILITLEHTTPEVTVKLCCTRLAPAPSWSHFAAHSKSLGKQDRDHEFYRSLSQGRQRTRQGNEQKTLTGELSGP